MPIYEYRCNNCGTFEVTQRITEDPLKKCPTCNGDVNRMISLTSFVLKGSGWYVTDYGRKGKSEASSSETPAATASTTTTNGESASAPPAKASAEGSSSSDKSAAKPSE